MEYKEYVNKVQESNKDDLIKELEKALASEDFTFNCLSLTERYIYFTNHVEW